MSWTQTSVMDHIRPYVLLNNIKYSLKSIFPCLSVLNRGVPRTKPIILTEAIEPQKKNAGKPGQESLGDKAVGMAVSRR